MSTIKVAASFISVQSIKPSQAFGTLASVPIKSGAKEILIRAGRTTLPRGAIITSAELHIAQADTATGSNTLSARLNLDSWDSTVTWNTRPSVRSTASGSDTKTGATPGSVWVIDVTQDVQDMYSGVLQHNLGWTLRTNNSTTAHYLRGRKATVTQPFLLLEYETVPSPPVDLSPQGGAVSVAKPIVTFQTTDNMIALQVQIDAAADAGSPDFDSGEVASTGGKLDLSATAYAGLSDGSTTYWRARAKGPGGWSRWSSWVSFSRNDLDAVTLTTPGATTADTSPPFAWTFGGTQKAWQADLLDMSTVIAFTGGERKVLRSSGLRSGTDDDWTPEPLKGNYFGTTLRARIRIFDDVTRIATPGVHTYSEDYVDFVASFSGSVDPVDTLVASQAGINSPGIVLSGTRAAGTPDEVAVFHDDEMVARLDGGDVFTSSTAFSFTDWWGRIGRSTVIKVVAIVNGDFADDSPTATITPKGRGIWLVDPATDVAAVLWDMEAGDVDGSDVASEHRTVKGEFVRRRLANAARSGSHSGRVLDVDDLDADDILDAIDTFRTNDAGTVYRLIRGRENLSVIAGNVLATPTSSDGRHGKAIALGRFDWWESADPIIVDGG